MPKGHLSQLQLLKSPSWPGDLRRSPGSALGPLQPQHPGLQKGRGDAVPPSVLWSEQAGRRAQGRDRRRGQLWEPASRAQARPLTPSSGVWPQRVAPAPSLTPRPPRCALFQFEPRLHRPDGVPLHVALLLAAPLLRRHAHHRQRHHPQRPGCHGKNRGQGGTALWLAVSPGGAGRPPDVERDRSSSVGALGHWGPDR